MMSDSTTMERPNNDTARKALGLGNRGPAFAIDPAEIDAEMERRGIAAADAEYEYDILNLTLPILLAELTVEYRDVHKVKSLTECETRAKTTQKYKDQVAALAAAKRAMRVAKVRERSFDARFQSTRSLISSERAAMQMR